ncbi:hypothetical protein Tsubulata_009326 [Turnera subulata]|uniref:Neprosin PEP catalytic domain-containing protein n=1 Tax=Turnera subulata TaxID=218843 RepID=A0A9Q0GFB0_9ROSI|nr:hypothetical protein Tsubulata_009326 [Turnera subulata]
MWRCDDDLQQGGRSAPTDGNGNWWVVVNGNIKIGNWPKEIFTSLGNGATSARYGGVTFANSDGINPPMGNGLPPTYDLKFTCSIIEMQLVDDKLVMHPVDPSIMKTNLDTSKDCYDVEYLKEQKGMGQVMIFGGKGGKNC